MLTSAHEARRLEQLYAITKLFVESRRADDALRSALEIVAGTLPVATAVMIEEDETLVWPTRTDGAARETAIEHARRAYAYLSGSTNEPFVAPPWATTTHPYIVLPLVVSGGEIFGVLQLEGAARFDRDDVAFVSAIAHQLATALARDRAWAADIERRREAELASARYEALEARARGQHELIRAMAAAIGEGMVATDLDGRVLLVNEVAETLLGCVEHAALGRPSAAILRFETEEGDEVASPAALAMQSGGLVRSDEYRLVRADGERFDASYTAAPFRQAGRIQGAVLAFDDIRERKRIARERQFLLRASVAVSSTLDAQRVLEELARVAVPMLGDVCVVDTLTTDGHLIRAAWAHVDPDRQIELDYAYRGVPPVAYDRKPVRQAIATGAPMLIPITGAAARALAAGNEVELLVLSRLGVRTALIVPLVLGARRFGAITFHLTGDRTYRDTTIALAHELAHRGAVALEHARLYEHAQDAIGVRDQLLAVVSHDLRAPLATIVMATGLLEDGNQVREASTKILHAASRMDRMIGDLLDYASIEAGKLSIVVRPHDVAGIFEETQLAFDELARARGIHLAISIGERVGRVLCDRDRILQVTANLVGNALKVVPPGGSVTVRAERHGDEVTFGVSDSGPGISERDQARLFERYWRSASAGYRGTGLGLSIARGLVEAHGGRIWVESELGAGATFLFTLPGAPPDAPRPGRPEPVAQLGRD